MDTILIRTAQEVAISAAYEAGRMLKEKFGRLVSYDEKDAHGDIVTEADHAAEAIILGKISAVFPHHHIRSEELGDNAVQSEWTWLVDPLDGTNNYAIGLPVFAVSITLLYKDTPVMAVIYEPITDRMYTTNKSGGAYCNNTPVSLLGAKTFHKARVGWIQGHSVQNDPAAVALRHYIDVNTKRMMRLWAPTLQWCMLARGDLDGIILYNSEGEDLYSGFLMVQEAGGIVIDYEGQAVSRLLGNPYLIACHPQHQSYFLEMVKAGLSVRTKA